MWLGIALALFNVVYLAIAVPAAALAFGVTYCLGVPARYFIALGRVLVVRPPRLPTPPRQPRPPAGADPAVLQYFYGPAVADAEQAIRAAYDDCRRFWDAGAARIRSFFRGDRPWVARPLGAGAAAGAVVAAGCALIQLVAVGVSAGLVRAAGAALRGADSAFLRVKNIRMVC